MTRRHNRDETEAKIVAFEAEDTGEMSVSDRLARLEGVTRIYHSFLIDEDVLTESVARLGVSAENLVEALVQVDHNQKMLRRVREDVDVIQENDPRTRIESNDETERVDANAEAMSSRIDNLVVNRSARSADRERRESARVDRASRVESARVDEASRVESGRVDEASRVESGRVDEASRVESRLVHDEMRRDRLKVRSLMFTATVLLVIMLGAMTFSFLVYQRATDTAATQFTQVSARVCEQRGRETTLFRKFLSLQRQRVLDSKVLTPTDKTEAIASYDEILTAFRPVVCADLTRDP